MKRLGLAGLILAVLYFCSGVPAARAGWVELGIGSASGGGISNNSGGSYFPGLNCTPLVAGSDGKPIAAWADDTNGNWEIYVRKWDGSSWVELGAGSATGGGVSNDAGTSDGPALAIAGDGNPILGWYDNTSGDYEIYVRKWNGSAWAELGAGSASGGGISNNTGKSSHLSIAIGADGNPIIAWEDNSGGDDEIYLRKWDGSSWVELGAGSATGGGVSNNTAMSRYPFVLKAADGNPIVAWSDYTPGNWDVYVRKWNGSAWAEMGTGSASGGGITNNAGFSYDPYLALGADGNPVMTWSDNTSGDYEIYVKRWDGSSWVELGTGSATGGGISNNTGGSNNPTLAVGPDGLPAIGWWDDSFGDSEIYLRKWSGAAWEEISPGSAAGGGVTNNPGQSYRSFMFFGLDGKLVVAWDDDTCGNREIYVLKLDPDLEPAGNLQAAPGNGQADLTWLKSVSPDAVSYLIYTDGGTGNTLCTSPVMSVLHPQESATLPGLINGQTYLIDLRTTNSANEVTTEPDLVSVTPLADPAGLVRAAIKIPQTGKRVAGNRVLVMAELEYGSPADVSAVRFQFRPEQDTVWTDLTPADPAQHPNPDTSSPYFIHLDLTGWAPGFYSLRAVASDSLGTPDSQPSFITIQVDNRKPEEVVETCSSGCIQEIKGKVFQGKRNDFCLGQDDANSFDQVSIPEGAINGVTDTVIITLENPAGYAGTCPDARQCGAGEYRKITLVSGQTSLNGGQVARIRMSYRDDDNDGIVDGTEIPEDILQPHRWLGDNLWEELPLVSIDPAANQVEFVADHFSTFALFGVQRGVVEQYRSGGCMGSAASIGGWGAGGDLGFSFLLVPGGIFLLKRKKNR